MLAAAWVRRAQFDVLPAPYEVFSAVYAAMIAAEPK